MYKIVIKYNGYEKDMLSEKDSLLSDVIKKSDIGFNFPCAGKGICGKCKIIILSGTKQNISKEERKHLSRNEIEHNIRLACFAKIESDMVIELKFDGEAQILYSFNCDNALDPIIKKKNITLDIPTIEDQRDDFTRLRDSLKIGNLHCSIDILKSLSSKLRENDYNMTVTLYNDKILDIESGDKTNYQFSLAVDIGTTTVVMYLVDMAAGKIMDSVGMLNSQKTYGDDVISRISYASENPYGRETLRMSLVNQINNMIKKICSVNSININSISALCIAANTAVTHLFLGLETENMAYTPFVPVCNDTMIFPAKDAGLSLGGDSIIIAVAGISAYVGGDVLAGILDCKMHEQDDLTLLIDIGTNGEIVLGNKDKMLCCSAAAGPAFEGCHIKCGSGGIAGAINKFSIENGEAVFTTIGDKPPRGICGSGILDIISSLMKEGVIDETGYLQTEEKIDDEIVYMLTEKIYITSKDIREVQLAKAAICAGINTLLHEMKISPRDVKRVYLAGGFGNFMDKDSAISIGLIPKEFQGKIINIGNSAGSGAVKILLNKALLRKISGIKDKMNYIELSGNAFFQDKYIESIMF